MIKIQDVPPEDYQDVVGLCNATLDQLTNLTPETIAKIKPTPQQVEVWSATKYRKQAILKGKAIAFFYLSPTPDKKPEIVRLDALGTDPDTPYEAQREAGFKLIRAAIDDYMKAGTKTAYGMGWTQSAAHSICTDLGLPMTEGGVNPVAHEPLQYTIDAPLTLVDELLKKQGL